MVTLHLVPRALHDTIAVHVLDTLRTLSANRIHEPSGWDRTWPILLGGALTIAGGFAAQWLKAWLDDRQRRNIFKEMIVGEMEALVVLLMTAAEEIRRTNKNPSFELMRIDRTREGYDQRRADVALIRPRALQHEVRTWYEALWMSRYSAGRTERVEEHFGTCQRL